MAKTSTLIDAINNKTKILHAGPSSWEYFLWSEGLDEDSVSSWAETTGCEDHPALDKERLAEGDPDEEARLYLLVVKTLFAIHGFTLIDDEEEDDLMTLEEFFAAYENRFGPHITNGIK